MFFFLPRKPILWFFQTASICLHSEVNIENITDPCRYSCKHFITWRMTQNLAKNIIGGVVSSYQANLVLEIPDITENYINSHVFTSQHWVSAMLISNIGHVVGMFDDWPDYFRFGGTPSKSECVEKKLYKIGYWAMKFHQLPNKLNLLVGQYLFSNMTSFVMSWCQYDIIIFEHDSRHFKNVRKLTMATGNLNWSSHEKMERLFQWNMTGNLLDKNKTIIG